MASFLHICAINWAMRGTTLWEEHMEESNNPISYSLDQKLRSSHVSIRFDYEACCCSSFQICRKSLDVMEAVVLSTWEQTNVFFIQNLFLLLFDEVITFREYYTSKGITPCKPCSSVIFPSLSKRIIHPRHQTTQGYILQSIKTALYIL